MIKNYAEGVKDKKILEIGSGKKVKGEYYYSASRFFDSSNTFIMSDINPDFGHLHFDILNPPIEEKFDVILCMNVLEHVYDFQKAVDNIYDLLVPGGEVVVFVPYMYPLHDEPHDYWRFTEHSLRKALKAFNTIQLEYSGIRKMPVAIFLIATT